MSRYDEREYEEIGFDRVLRVTDKAVLFKTQEADEGQIWIPKSCLRDPDEYEEGDTDGMADVETGFASRNSLG